MSELADRLIDAALEQVVFDGWSEAVFMAATRQTGTDEAMARALFPRGAVDMALAFHRRGDRAMVQELRRADLGAMRIRDRIACAVRTRLEVVEARKEAVRRGITLFALPMYAADGVRAIWETSDAIWNALGDPSDDINWYTKRGTLSGVYSATVLYWLGDQSQGHAATLAFLDRRTENVVQFENLKRQVRENRLLRPFLAGPDWLLNRVKAPSRMSRMDLPGRWTGQNTLER